MEKIKVHIPVIVEGKYDKIRLSQILDANIVPTDGFGIFKGSEKMMLIRRLGERGVILLCDSDGAGKVIRGHLKSALPPDTVYDLYTPQIRGKEKRKNRASKEGFLGVEGVDNTILRELFLRFLERHPELGEIPEGGKEAPPVPAITKTDLFSWGLNGCADAAARRDRLCALLGLPAGMTSNALLSALQMLCTPAEVEALLEKL